MKASLILSLLICIGLSQINLAQTSIKTYKKDSDQENIELRMEDQKIIFLKLNGEVIEKEDYNLYQDIIKKVITDVPTPPTPPTKPTTDKEYSFTDNDPKDMLVAKMKSLLQRHNLIESSQKYKLKLTHAYFKVNGKKTAKDVHQQAIEIYEKVLKRKFSENTKVKIKEKNANKNVSIIENRTFYFDSELDF